VALTGPGSYFEDFRVGDVLRHARGRTICEHDNVGMTLQVLNTAQAHFNEHAARRTLPGRLVFGGVTIAMVIGLTMQDTAENAVAELGLSGIRLRAPVFHGDTLYAYSEVLAASDSARADAGVLSFRHYGVNQRDELVFEGERRVLVKRRPA
jgi:acyl dehydratase